MPAFFGIEGAVPTLRSQSGFSANVGSAAIVLKNPFKIMHLLVA